MFTKCLRCNYDLTGLPTAHACPECGLTYHKNAEVLQASPHVGTVWLLAKGLFLLAYGAAAISLMPLEPLYSLLMLGWVGLIVWLHFTARNRRVVLSEQGILVASAHGAVRVLPWCDVRIVESDSFLSHVIIRGHDGRPLATFDHRYLPASVSVDEAADRGEAWRLAAQGGSRSESHNETFGRAPGGSETA